MAWADIPIHDGPVNTEYGLRCYSSEARCRNLLIYDWHYEYCAAQPDTAPGFRQGTCLNSDKPNAGCPYHAAHAAGDHHDQDQ